MSVNQWGYGEWSSMYRAFYGATNLQSFPDESPVLTDVDDMSYMFYGAESFNQAIGSWNVSSVNDMSYMLLGANSFNQDIGDWDVSSVTNMTNMF